MALPEAIAANKFATAVAAVACAGPVVALPIAMMTSTGNDVDRFGVREIYPSLAAASGF
jgi:hypothetical protein